MSAFLVSDAHLDYLVNFALQKKITVYTGNGTKIDMAEENDPQRMFNILYKENLRSVDTRYDEKNIVTPSQFRRKAQNFDMVQVLKACDCYSYQTCENDDYRQSIAYKIISMIRSCATGALPGYDKATWEIQETKPEQKAAI